MICISCDKVLSPVSSDTPNQPNEEMFTPYRTYREQEDARNAAYIAARATKP